MPAKPISLIDRKAVIALRHESNAYSQKKPGHVPPADSPTRPNLAWLWLAAYRKLCKRPARTFTHHGYKFGVVFVGDDSLYVMDLAMQRLLVKPPASMTALCSIAGARDVLPTDDLPTRSNKRSS